MGGRANPLQDAAAIVGIGQAYVHGFNLVTEGVRQRRGTSTSQVEGAATCPVTSGAGVPTSAVVLRAA